MTIALLVCKKCRTENPVNATACRECYAPLKEDGRSVTAKGKVLSDKIIRPGPSAAAPTQRAMHGKRCPKCSTLSPIRSYSCVNPKCDHDFDPAGAAKLRERLKKGGTVARKKKDNDAPPATKAGNEEFAVGVTTHKGLFLYWCKKEEFVLLTAEETEFVRLVLGLTEGRPK